MSPGSPINIGGTPKASAISRAAAAFSATKSMSAGDSTATLVTLNLFLTVPMAALVAAPVWATPDLHQIGLLALQGVLGAACMALMTHAFSLADASIVAPVDFLRLPLIALTSMLRNVHYPLFV